MTALPDSCLDTLFRDAHTHHSFAPEPVSDQTLRNLYDLYRWGPTSMNCQPSRVVFVRSAEGKARLAPALAPGNLNKTMAAPVTAIVAMDPRFFERLPEQFPVMPAARSMFADDVMLAAQTAQRNSSLQGAYLMIAARALGLAVGPMSGFNPRALNEAFFANSGWEANFLVNLGWSHPNGVRPRGPRLAFDEAVQLA